MLRPPIFVSVLDELGEFLDRVRRSDDLPAGDENPNLVKANFDALAHQGRSVAQKIKLDVERVLTDAQEAEIPHSSSGSGRKS